MQVLDVIVKLYTLLVAIDVLVGWIQPDPSRTPRRLTHALTEPPQALLRMAVPARLTWGWDLSPLMVIAILGVIRMVWTRS